MGLLKKYCTIVKNKRNNQINLSLKKSVMKDDGIDLDDILEMKLQERIKKGLYRK